MWITYNRQPLEHLREAIRHVELEVDHGEIKKKIDFLEQ
jgi:hypothetical protein